MKDLKNELTVFVIDSGGNPNSCECIKSLKTQSCEFTLTIIQDIAPLSLAFQKMLDWCETPYFIECDSDMLLNDNTIEHMYNDIILSSHSMFCYQLKDVHLDFLIYGIKIYKTEVFKKYPYKNVASCEVEQLDRITKDGYTYKFMEYCQGKHSPLWSNELIFNRYFNLLEKYKLYKYNWMGKLLSKLKDLYKTNPTDLNFYALAGALSSVYSSNVIEKEKDFTIKNRDYLTTVDFLKRVWK